MRVLVAAAAACGLALVLAGAAGGHAAAFGLAADAPDVVLRAGLMRRVSWESGMVFGFAHVAAAMLAAALPLGRMRLWAGWAFLAGVVLFSFSLVGRTLIWMQAVKTDVAANPAPWLGMLAPFGGLSFMAGWALLLAAALMQPKTLA